jgi:hypothetical protein
MAAPEKSKEERGILSFIGIAIGVGCLVIALVGVLNTALDLKLALSVYGSSTPIPNSYDEVAGLAAAGAIIIGLSMFGSFVLRKFSAAKGKPLVRAGILAGAAVLLILVGRGIQILALKSTYGSMLAYYATDGDLEDVKAELAKKPDREALDKAVSRAGQYNNAPALALLLEAGADMRASTWPEEQRRCALVGRSYEFTKTAIDHGVKPDACPRGEAAVWEAVREGKDDAETAKTVALLIGAGFSASAKPEYDERSAKQIATQKKWSKTVEALGGAGQ